MTKNEKIWPEWDAELNWFGQWLLVGCIACASVPPIPGFVALVAIVYVGLTRTEPKADKLFSERRILLEKEKTGDIAPREANRLDRLLGDLRRTQKRRDLRVYLISWIVLILTMALLFYEFFSIPPARWLI
ncbi:MAG TPA: hypothetical protein VGM64_02170 [Lacunisphaera sp.]|jgi:hypothetical protein